MTIDIDQVIAAIQRDDYTGICRECGAERGMCEPDARKYRCESCGAMEVYGAEELLLMIPEPDRPSPEDYYDGQADAMQT